MQALTTVIIGAGHAGVHTAATLRSRGAMGRIVLIDQEPCQPFERPPLSKDVLLGKGEPSRLRKESFYDEQHIELRTGTRVTAIYRAGRCVHFADGTTLGYDHLVIATGSIPRPLPVQGATLSGVVTLRTPQEALQIRAHLHPGARVAIVGAGYIGLEVAAAAASAGAQVTVIEREDRVLSRVASVPVSDYFQRLHAAHGVRFLLSRSVSSVAGDQWVETVTTTQGDRLPADLLVVGIGVVAADQLARAAGLACDQGILVDEDCRSSDPHIYAVGDVSRFHHPLLGASARLESIPNALEHAERAAKAMLGLTSKAREVPWFWSIQYDCKLQSAGMRRTGDRTVVRGDPDTGRFTVLYLRGSSLGAIDAIGMGSDFIAGRKGIASGAQLDAALLADPAIPLSKTFLTTESMP